MSKVGAISYSASLAAAAAGTPQRGSVHSVFAAAANIVFPTGHPDSGHLRGADTGRVLERDGVQVEPGAGFGRMGGPLRVAFVPCFTPTKGERKPPARGHPATSPHPWLYSPHVSPPGSLLLSEFVLSLNALDAPGMPNGLRLSVPAGAFPFTALRPGMSVLFGAQRLHIEAIECSFDLSICTRWDPHIYHPDTLDRCVLQENSERLATIRETHSRRGAIKQFDQITGIRNRVGADLSSAPPIYRPASQADKSAVRSINRRLHGFLSLPGYFVKIHDRAPTFRNPHDIRHMAESLCGRGVGLTPAGDDVLAGWMAVGWLLYGPEPDFLEACRQIVEVARRQTHLLSQCWLADAARGDVARPVVALLEALALPRTSKNDTQLEQAAQVVLAMGATSGSDVITGILLGLQTYLASCTEEE